MRFSIGGTLAAGLTATLVLTFLFYLPALFFLPFMDIFELLGGFFSPEGAWQKTIGLLLHLGIGIGSALLYAALWRLGIGSPTGRVGLLFGLLHGVGSVCAYQVLYALLPQEPPVYMSWGKSLTVLIAFAGYGITLGLTCRPWASATGNKEEYA